MIETFRSARLYFWPIVTANVMAMGYATGAPSARGLILLSLSLATLASFGFLVNDLSDREIDGYNAAGHFEHASVRTIRQGAAAAALLGLLSGACAVALGQRELLLWAILAAVLLVYSPWLRRVRLLANIATALVASAPIWWPLLFQADGVPAWSGWLVASAVSFILSREIVMDVRDRAGDARGGRETLATWLGSRPAIVAARLATLLSVLLLLAGVATAFPAVSRLRILAAIVVCGAAYAPVFFSLFSLHTEARAIQGYVLRSRATMLHIPLVVALLGP